MGVVSHIPTLLLAIIRIRARGAFRFLFGGSISMTGNDIGFSGNGSSALSGNSQES